MRFAQESVPFTLPVALAAVACFALGWPIAGAVATLLALLVLLFFRDPARHPTAPPEAILAASDGTVIGVETVEDAAVGPGLHLRIATFLSVFDVHVQKTPTDGRIAVSRLVEGKKVAAFRGDAHIVNEQHLTVLERADGTRIGVRQIAGLVARRVVCQLKEGQGVSRSQPLGVIKFGSRVDVLVPADYRALVARGDKLRNGETPVAVPPGR